jgi:hypothetical protein
LTLADTEIPTHIINGEKYKALPIINYRKEAADGTLLSDQKGAGTTSGEAYALIPERQRRKLERRGIIEKTRPTAITGIPKSEAKAMLKAEKAALKDESKQLSESAKENAKLAKETAKLAKSGTKSDRQQRREQALEYANRSADESRRARELARTERELKNLKADYTAKAARLQYLSKRNEVEIRLQQHESKLVKPADPAKSVKLVKRYN